MQDINNKLKEILEKLTDALSHLQTIEQKQDTMIDLLRTIAANTTK